MTTFYIIPSNSDIQHHGVLGMKWGIRRYQNKDGSLTSRGKRRLGIGSYSNGVTGQRVTATNTNKSGVTKRERFSDYSNLRETNKILKDKNNCSLCTFAFDLRNRGIDVRAGGSTEMKDGKTPAQISSWYREKREFNGRDNQFFGMFDETGNFKNSRNTQKQLYDNDQKFKKDIISQGEGTSGHLLVQHVLDNDYKEKTTVFDTNLMGGHDIFYRVENGDVYIYDAQVGKRVPYDEYTKFREGTTSKHTWAYLRTDDLTPVQNMTTKNEDGSYSLVAPQTHTAEYNYSPMTGKIIRTKPLNYNPPYKSQTEMEALIDDVGGLINKAANSVKNVVNNVSDGLKKFKKSVSNAFNTISWKIFN